jgi:hypothetical protein
MILGTSADALVHQLGDIGRLQVPFLGDRPDTAPDCIDGMRAIALKTVGGLPPRDIRKSGFRLLADFFITHDCTAFPAGSRTMLTTLDGGDASAGCSHVSTRSCNSRMIAFASEALSGS